MILLMMVNTDGRVTGYRLADGLTLTTGVMRDISGVGEIKTVTYLSLLQSLFHSLLRSYMTPCCRSAYSGRGRSCHS